MSELIIGNLLERDSTASMELYKKLQVGSRLINPYGMQSQEEAIKSYKADWSEYQGKPFLKLFDFVPGDVIAVQYYQKDYAFFVLYAYEAKIYDFTSSNLSVNIDDIIKKPIKFSCVIDDRFINEEIIFHKVGHVDLGQEAWDYQPRGSVIVPGDVENRKKRNIQYLIKTREGDKTIYTETSPEEVFKLPSEQSHGVAPFLMLLQRCFLKGEDIQAQFYNLDKFVHPDYDIDFTDVFGLIEKARNYAASKNGSINEILNYIKQELTSSDILVGKVAAFDSYISECLSKLHTPYLWAAAYLILGGCSDDTFFYFKYWVLLQGYDFYRAAVWDTDKLADMIPEIEIDLLEEQVQEASDLISLGDRCLEQRKDKDDLPKYGVRPNLTEEPNIESELQKYDFDDGKQMKKILPKLYKRFVENAV